MTERRPKRPRDPAQLAKLIIDIATGEASDEKPKAVMTKSEAAKIGGRRRSELLSKKRKTEIAKNAARQRWNEKA